LSEKDGNDYSAMVKLYEQIERCIAEIVTRQGREGVLTDWLILSAVQSFDDDGIPITNTGWHTNPENGIPFHRLLGLLKYNEVLLERECE